MLGLLSYVFHCPQTTSAELLVCVRDLRLPLAACSDLKGLLAAADPPRQKYLRRLQGGAFAAAVEGAVGALLGAPSTAAEWRTAALEASQLLKGLCVLAGDPPTPKVVAPADRGGIAAAVRGAENGLLRAPSTQRAGAQQQLCDRSAVTQQLHSDQRQQQLHRQYEQRRHCAPAHVWPRHCAVRRLAQAPCWRCCLLCGKYVQASLP